MRTQLTKPAPRVAWLTLVSKTTARTWNAPYRIADVIGAYPSSVELRDGSVLFIYYTEGAGSVIRAARYGVGRDGLKPMPPG